MIDDAHQALAWPFCLQRQLGGTRKLERVVHQVAQQAAQGLGAGVAGHIHCLQHLYRQAGIGVVARNALHQRAQVHALRGLAHGLR